MIRSIKCRALLLAGLLASASALAWEPTKPVEFVVPAGTGGGADQMARFIQGVVAKNKLMTQPIIVVNKSGGAGAEGFLDVKGDKGNPHKIVITLSNLFTTPLATGVPFNWRDLTPVRCSRSTSSCSGSTRSRRTRRPRHYLDAIQAAARTSFKMGGTGSKQEDQIITVLLEKAAGKKLTYIPFKGGGDVAVQLVGKHIDSTVNNPIEAESHWRAGKLRAAVRDGQGAHAVPGQADGDDVVAATSRPAPRPALPVDYLMLRGIFMPPGVTPEQVAFYVDLFKKLRAPARVEGVHGEGRVQADQLTRRGLRRLARQERADAPHADEGSRLPGAMMSASRRLHAGERQRSAEQRLDESSRSPSAGPSSPSRPVLVAVGRCSSSSTALRVGIGWADDGPRSGYFPFYIGLLLLAASGCVLISTLLRWRGSRRPFAEREQLEQRAGGARADAPLRRRRRRASGSTCRRCC